MSQLAQCHFLPQVILVVAFPILLMIGINTISNASLIIKITSKLLHR